MEKKNSRSSLKGFQNWHLCLSPASGTELQMPTKKTTTSGKDMMVFLRTQTPAFKGEQQMKLMTKHLYLCARIWSEFQFKWLIVSWNAVYSNVIKKTYMPKKHHILSASFGILGCQPTSWPGDWSDVESRDVCRQRSLENGDFFVNMIHINWFFSGYDLNCCLNLLGIQLFRNGTKQSRLCLGCWVWVFGTSFKENDGPNLWNVDLFNLQMVQEW